MHSAGQAAAHKEAGGRIFQAVFVALQFVDAAESVPEI